MAFLLITLPQLKKQQSINFKKQGYTQGKSVSHPKKATGCSMNATTYKQQLLNKLYEPYCECNGCHFNMPPATQIVFGEGNPNANLLFIGEAPGREEDLAGKPFVGRSGKLLNRIFEAAGLTREDAFITNVVKCRPPNNRRPLPSEIEANKELLLGQIKIIQPKVICTLGSAALEGLTGKTVKITKEHGKHSLWNGIVLMPAYHPAYILRNPKELKALMADIVAAIHLSSS